MRMFFCHPPNMVSDYTNQNPIRDGFVDDPTLPVWLFAGIGPGQANALKQLANEALGTPFDTDI